MRHLLVLYLSLVSVGVASAASWPDDADLYYRRTHDGALPPPGYLSDHAEETGDARPATPWQPQKSFAPAAQLDGGVDPANLGKGDWLWQLPTCISSLGFSTVQQLIDYEKNKGMQWITVKCGNGASIWTQFDTNLIQRTHAAGMKIFGWAYMYGNDVPGEINMALNALALGADGFIIDAETEYETLANNSTAATTFCQAIKAAYPNRFLAHAPFPIISSHSGFPYVAFGRYCDVVMPQAYWADIGGVNYAIPMVTRMNNEWRNWQNSLTGTNTSAIKPIIPIGQAYNSVNGTVTGQHISDFMNALKTNTPPATAGGYKGVSFWSCQSHSTDMWNAIGAIQIGTNTDPPLVINAPANLSVDPGTNVTFSAVANGGTPLRYQWRFFGTNLPGATNTAFTRSNVQFAHAGPYTVIVTNHWGTNLSAVAQLVVNVSPVWQLVWSDDFETNSAARWNLFAGSGNGTDDYTASYNFDFTATTYTSNGVANPIPSAPHGSATKRALKLTVNKNDAVAATAGVSLYPKSLVLSNNHALRFDVWLNYNGPAGGSAGSTEYATFGLNHAGTRVNWSGGTSGSSDGLWFGMNGEGGSGLTDGDYVAYVGNPPGIPAKQSSAISGLTANGAIDDDSTDPFFQALFPAPAYESLGAPGKHWVEVELSQVNGVLTWRCHGLVVAQRTNNTAFTNGTPMIGYMDIYTSIPSPTTETFALIDNVRLYTAVIAPEIAAQPTNRVVNAGASVNFAATVTGSLPMNYQWRRGGSILLNATNAVLVLTNVHAVQAGDYSLVASNPAGSATSSNATLTVTTLQLGGLLATNGGWLLTASGAPGPGYVVETSTNLTLWTPLVTLTNSTGTLQYLVPGTDGAQLFLRVRAPE